MHKLFASSLLVVTAVAVAAACDSTDDDAGSPVDITNVGQCSPAAGVAAIDGRFPVSAVPSGGACDASTTCHIAVDDCPGDWPPASTRVSEYECDCAGGAWSCMLAIEGTSACPADGGSEASVDGGDASSLGDASEETTPDGGAALDAGPDGQASVDASDEDAGPDAQDASGDGGGD